MRKIAAIALAITLLLGGYGLARESAPQLLGDAGITEHCGGGGWGQGRGRWVGGGGGGGCYGYNGGYCGGGGYYCGGYCGGGR